MSTPQILKLDHTGHPVRWIDYERAAYYFSLDKILWTLDGDEKIILRGGTNAITQKRSTLELPTIIAVESDNKKTFRKSSPSLTNKTLFERDHSLCAYCGGVFSPRLLTRDHVQPSSRGGKDIWENVVTACTHCNGWKADRTPEEADMTLLYVPYKPSFHEHLILSNRRILASQMDFLMKGVGPNSRLHDKRFAA